MRKNEFHKPKIWKARSTEVWHLRWYENATMKFVTAQDFEEICLKAKYCLKEKND